MENRARRPADMGGRQAGVAKGALNWILFGKTHKTDDVLVE